MFHKKSYFENQKLDSDVQLWPWAPRAPQFSTLDFKKIPWVPPPPRKSGRSRGKGLLTFLQKVFFSQAYRGTGRRRQFPLDGATDFLSKIWQHITTISFVQA